MFGMFTPAGDGAVLTALLSQLESIRAGIPGHSGWVCYKPLDDVLSAIEVEVMADHPEVTDTAVRDAIYLKLLDNHRITQMEMVG